jgi:wyosine [tRNA(Phe)-imidazoG37] synthetase (radical SAM superfamily)
MMNSTSKYVFGPVPSRRLGCSLGVDLIPYKTCSYDCIYCQLGRTVEKTLARKEYVPLEAVLDETARRLGEGVEPDYVTLSGSGEPTLYSRLDELIAGIRRLTCTPIAVLTNGSLLWMPEVRRALLETDVVIPSLDAGSEEVFQTVNRPHRKLDFAEVLSGMASFRQEFGGQIWLEVFLLKRFTADPAQVGRIARLAEILEPDRIQLNTVLRPPAEKHALAVDPAAMRSLAALFGDRVEVIADPPASSYKTAIELDAADIMGLLRRRPCTIQDVSRGLGIPAAEAAKRLEILQRDGMIAIRRSAGRVFYLPSRAAGRTVNRQ